MLQIGITGGIGSGKTTVCKVFQSLGVPVFNADMEARDIVSEDASVIKAIKLHFGADIYGDDGQLDRKAMAGKVFADAGLLNKLNGIVHPAVGRKYEDWIKDHHNHHYVLKEAAILFESGSYRDLDKIIVVAAPEELRIKRVMERDGVTEEEVKERMSRQLSEEDRINKADYIIYNDEEQMIIPQVMALHEKFNHL